MLQVRWITGIDNLYAPPAVSNVDNVTLLFQPASIFQNLAVTQFTDRIEFTDIEGVRDIV